MILQARAGRMDLVQPELTLEAAQNSQRGPLGAARVHSRHGQRENITSQHRDDVPDELQERMATETFPFRLQEPEGLRVVVEGAEYTIGRTTTVSVLWAGCRPPALQHGRPKPSSTVTFVPSETDPIETSAR